jgi:hypothetical protein
MNDIDGWNGTHQSGVRAGSCLPPVAVLRGVRWSRLPRNTVSPNSLLKPRKHTSMDRERWALSSHRMQVEAVATTIATKSPLAL